MSVLGSDFERFMNAFIRAGARIESHYFQLPVAGCVRPVFRERVYCYELYHQLRIDLGHNFDYKLDGEVDKVGHPLISPRLGPRKPDFIVHDPGDMGRNLAVIEVKSSVAPINGRSGLREDLRTLQGFLDRARYYRGIMLVYGDGTCELPRRIRSAFERVHDSRVVKVWHKGPGIEPTIVHE